MSGYAKTPTVYQFEATECGAASLSMIFSYFGKYMPLTQLRVETGVSRDGCNAGNILRCAKKYGLDCKGYRKPASALMNVKVPCIIHWNGNHFVVFEGFKGKYAYINDPASGRRKMTADELSNGFSGTVLTFEVTNRFQKEKKKHPVAAYVKRAIKENRVYSSFYFIASLVTAFPVIALSYLAGSIADSVFGSAVISDTKIAVLLFSAFIIVLCLSLYFSEKVLHKLKKRLILLLSKDFMRKLFRLPAAFFEQRYTGDISGSSVCPSDIYTVIADKLAFALSGVFSSAVCLVLLSFSSPYIALVAFISIIPYILIAKICSFSLSDASVKYRQDSGILLGKLTSGLGITETIKASGAEKAYSDAIIEQHIKAEDSKLMLDRVRSVTAVLSFSVKILFGAVILILCAFFVHKGEFTFGEALKCLMLFGIFTRPLKTITGFSGVINSLKAEIGRVEDISAYPYDDKYISTEKYDISTKLEGSVELKNVSFGYGALTPPVVKDISFFVGCGSSIAVVGMSGSGKSTVSKLISGLYKPQSGEILFDGVPEGKIPHDVLSASISTVSQKITLFSGSIRDNLTLWNTGISEADMTAAAKDACIHNVIAEKEGGYDYVLTKGGQNLSGGQRQCLEIARALAINPTVLIMDEATSALDSVTEKNILDNIKRRGCTCIVIAHRLSAIRDCDKIIVMDNGKIVQYGSHIELCKTEGLYRNFITADQGEKNEY